MTDIKILIATHKEFIPPRESHFIPIHVGKEGQSDLGYIGDDSGDNISSKNKNYCELTALYWAWKNLNCDVLGLCHYRRYFDIENRIDKINDIRYVGNNEFNKYSFSEQTIKKYLLKNDVILPKPKRYFTSIKQDYAYCHLIEDYEILTEVINTCYPEYIDSWYKISNFKNSLVHYNMFITSKNIADDYFEWLFTILFEAEKRVKLSPYIYQQRVFGFMSERLMTLYFYHNKFRKKYLPVLFLKEENLEKHTPHKSVTLLLNIHKNLIFFLWTFPKKVLKNYGL
ncbi:DUF4422 domain-containing protein [Tenacibaculum sp. TC6]|uniref:DUF4422 domain-containing protein n=1 Tax=Tenacibaculum sp. TC6 TaxID=3423223 RepID=UPI003D35F419